MIFGNTLWVCMRDIERKANEYCTPRRFETAWQKKANALKVTVSRYGHYVWILCSASSKYTKNYVQRVPAMADPPRHVPAARVHTGLHEQVP